MVCFWKPVAVMAVCDGCLDVTDGFQREVLQLLVQIPEDREEGVVKEGISPFSVTPSLSPDRSGTTVMDHSKSLCTNIGKPSIRLRDCKASGSAQQQSEGTHFHLVQLGKTNNEKF